MYKKVTIDEIAREVGVSRGTVSRAFNERSDINAKTREKVLRVAKELGYLPNTRARGLAKGRSECVGIVVPDITNPYLPEMVSSIERHARKRGFSCILGVSGDCVKLQSETVLRMASGQVDGIIMTPCEDSESVELMNLVSKRIPIIALKSLEGLECDVVMGHDKMALSLLIGHLADLGHERIAFLSPDAPRWTVKQRKDAFLEAIAQYKVPSKRHIMFPGDSDLEKALHEIAKDFLGAKDAPTAVCAYDDIIAIRFIHELGKLGLKVPDDVSVTGFDDISFSEISAVPLTTVAVDSGRLGESAVETLCKRLEESPRRMETRNIVLMPDLKVRGSTGKPRMRMRL